MVRPIVLAFALSLGSSVYAMPAPSLQQSDDMVVTVRQGCGAGFRRVRGVCVRNTAVRTFRRCAAGLRLVGGRCIRR